MRRPFGLFQVKPELKQAFNQLCSDVVLHIRVIIAVHLREVADISGIALTVLIEVYSDEISGLADLPADPEAGSSKVFSFI